MASGPDVTEHLRASRRGDPQATERLWGTVYDELRKQARRQLRRHRPGQTLNTTALVHEAYLKLAGQDIAYENRLHFYAISAQVMRHLIIDQARRKGSQKRGGDFDRVSLKLGHVPVRQRAVLFIDLDDALDRLADLDARLAEVVEYRFFGGMTLKEIADQLDLSVPTISRDWRRAKAFLSHELGGQAA